MPGVTAGADGGVGWWSDTQADLMRKACDKGGNYCYTPLYAMKRRTGLFARLFREDGTPETPPTGDDMCVRHVGLRTLLTDLVRWL